MKIKRLKENIFNRIMLNGKKQTSEKLFLRSLKKIQKNYTKKNFEDLVKIGLINSAPIIFLKQIKRKRKRTVEFPFLLELNSRMSYGIKHILNNCRKKKSISFYNQLELEFINSAKNISQSVKKKKELHQESFLKKKFANYRWF